MQKSLSLGRFLVLLIEPCKGVFRTSSGRFRGTSLEHRQHTSLGGKYQTVWGGTHNIGRRRLQAFSRGRPTALHIGQYGDVLRTSYFNVLRTSVGDVPWRYTEDHLRTSIGRLLETSSGPRDLILPSGKMLNLQLKISR